jgi:Cu+-exporting ATPase
MATDPVCGMIVEEATALWKSKHQDETYYFCSPVCKRTFEENAHFLTKEVKQKMHGVSFENSDFGPGNDAL